MPRPDSPPRLTNAQLRAEAYGCQRAWVRRAGAFDAAGHPRAIFERDRLVAARTGTTGAIMLPDPSDANLALPHALDWLRHTGCGDVLVWADVPSVRADRLLSAHGARESFVPCWMSHPTSAPLPPAPERPAVVRRAIPGDLPRLLAATDLPYHSPWQIHATLRLAIEANPDDVALVVALIDDAVVGRGVLSRTAASAGIYDVGVTLRHQRLGIGRQLMHALLRIARGWQVERVTLNAAPAGLALYRSLGFEEIGEGQTWHLPAEVLRHPPGDATVAFALAISAGDGIAGMEARAGRHLPNGDTPLAHAARFDQPEIACALLAAGTIIDIAALWDLGLEAEARRSMRNHPDALDARRGAQQATPLHIAIHWEDLEFLEALLDAGADPYIRDGTFDGDAWGWCHALGNDAALAILNARFPDHVTRSQRSPDAHHP